MKCSKKMQEGYPSNWAKVTLIVSPSGETHVLGGDREPGEGNMPYIGFERIKDRLKPPPPMDDFQKLECPFNRVEYRLNADDHKKYGSKFGLRTREVLLAEPDINPHYKWVLEEPQVQAIEKLNGTNVRIRTENGRLIQAQNRKDIIDPLQIMKGKAYLVEGIFMAIQKGYVLENGIQDGEIVGPNVQGNQYGLDHHIWHPFTKSYEDLAYRSFHEYDKTYENWSQWFRKWLVSRFWAKRQPFGEVDVNGSGNVMAEGIVFYRYSYDEHKQNPMKSWRCKLRRDMFPWFYTDAGMRIEERWDGEKWQPVDASCLRGAWRDEP